MRSKETFSLYQLSCNNWTRTSTHIITAIISILQVDLNHIYGEELSRQHKLRLLKDGKLKYQVGFLLLCKLFKIKDRHQKPISWFLWHSYYTGLCKISKTCVSGTFYLISLYFRSCDFYFILLNLKCWNKHFPPLFWGSGWWSLSPSCQWGSGGYALSTSCAWVSPLCCRPWSLWSGPRSHDVRYHLASGTQPCVWRS